MPNVVCQKWEESEAGWGTRPDGYTLHVDREAATRWAKAFWKRQREVCGPGTPSEYSRKDGEPYECPVDDELYEQIVAAGDGAEAYALGLTDTSPWPGGRTGWTSRKPPKLYEGKGRRPVPGLAQPARSERT